MNFLVLMVTVSFCKMKYEEVKQNPSFIQNYKPNKYINNIQ